MTTLSSIDRRKIIILLTPLSINYLPLEYCPVKVRGDLVVVLLRTLPIPVAYLRAGSFMENWLGALDHIRATGEMPFFYAPLERKLPLVAARDIGLAGAKV